ncbi:MAG: hypothetical protein RBT41_12015 [Clostridia bacterium]|nr:hypothetical protein [Clostridia bacterium]
MIILFPMNRLMEKKILSNINHIVNALIELSYTEKADKEPFYQEAATLLREIHPLLLRLIDGKTELLESLVRQLISQKLPPPSIQTSFGSLQEDLNTVIKKYLAQKEQLSAETESVAAMTEEPALLNEESAEENTEEEAAPAVKEMPSPEEDLITEEPIAEELIDVPAAETIEKVAEESAADIITATEQPLAILPPQESAPPEETVIHPPTAKEKSVPDILQSVIDILYAKEKIIKGYLYRSLQFDYYLPERKIAITAIKPLQRKYLVHELLLKKDGITLLEITPEEAANKSLLYNKLQRYC